MSSIINPLDGGAGGLLVDPHGRPFPPGEERARAEAELKDFMEKNKSRFQKFWQEFGFGRRPPIKYDLGNRKWHWIGD